jgi:hypothetical protein
VKVLQARIQTATFALLFFFPAFFPALQIFKCWQNSKLTTHSSLVSEKYNTEKEKEENSLERNA